MPRNLEAVSQYKISTKRSSNRGLWHIAAHHANFWAIAICEPQLILRRCGCGVGGVEQNAARSIYAYLSTFNRKMLRIKKSKNFYIPLCIVISGRLRT